MGLLYWLLYSITGRSLVSKVLRWMGLDRGQYIYIHDLMDLDSHRPLSPVQWCTMGPSPLRLDRLQEFLWRFPDKRLVSYLHQGFSGGFRLGFDRTTRLRPAWINHPSSTENPRTISEFLTVERELGRFTGPVLPSPHIHTSPMGLVPKSHSDKWRLIFDLSSPHGHSINDGISSELCSLRYASLDNAVEIIMGLGRSTALAKFDLSNAYRIVPVHPEDQPLLGIYWQGAVYMDRSLPFGLRSAPKIFNAVADVLAWILHDNGLPYVLHYLDDFLLMAPAGSSLAVRMTSLVESIFGYVGAPIAHHKTEGPSTVLTFLGIEIDTVRFQLSLPLEKVRRLRELLAQWRHRHNCTKRELQSFLGHLSHAAIVIRPGRIFLRSLFSRLSRLSRPFHYTRLTLPARMDIRWWHYLLLYWNGRSFFPSAVAAFDLYSDASGSFGCGAFNPDQSLWFQLSWPQSWSSVNIAAKELVPIVVAASIWGAHWSGSHVCFHCDNEAVVKAIQNHNAHEDTLIQLLRCLFFYSARFQFHFSAKHIPGKDNVIADAISRNNTTLLSSITPQAQQVSVPAPVEAFLLFPPDWGSQDWILQFVNSLQVACPPAHAGVISPE